MSGSLRKQERRAITLGKIGKLKYLSPVWHLRNLINGIKTWSERLRSIEDNNPFVMFQSWLLGLIQYGLLTLFAYYALFMATGWLWLVLLGPALAVIRWLALDFIEDVKEKLK